MTRILHPYDRSDLTVTSVEEVCESITRSLPCWLLLVFAPVGLAPARPLARPLVQSVLHPILLQSIILTVFFISQTMIRLTMHTIALFSLLTTATLAASPLPRTFGALTDISLSKRQVYDKSKPRTNRPLVGILGMPGEYGMECGFADLFITYLQCLCISSWFRAPLRN